jgi:hypothetical protein
MVPSGIGEIASLRAQSPRASEKARHARCLSCGIRFFFEVRTRCSERNLMALFAMLFAATSALTLIHFVSRPRLARAGRSSGIAQGGDGRGIGAAARLQIL